MPSVSDYTAIINGPTYWGTGNPGKPVFLTYSFNTAPASYLPASISVANGSFQPFTEDEKAMTRDALAQWGAASGITFFEVPAGQGDIQYQTIDFDLLGDTYKGFGGFMAQFPSGPGESDLTGDVFVSTHLVHSYFKYLILHETGHALGLKHTFVGNPTLATDLDNWSQTVMTYTLTGPFNGTLGPLDVQAIQYLYGTPDKDGSQVASWSWDAASNTLTQTGGDGADIIRGVAVADIIHGGAGKDTIYGNDGNDQIYGGEDDDTIYGGQGVNILYGEGGNDIVNGFGTGQNTIYGGDGDDTLGGSASDDTLIGGDGNDTLTSGSGVNILDGGIGIDTLNMLAARSNYTVTQTSPGHFRVTNSGASSYSDTLTGVEYIKFTDQKIRLLPGSGVSIDPGAAPSAYMGAIRDFDGNSLTGLGTQVIDPGTGGLIAGGAWDGVSGWSVAGNADVSGSGSISQILFNNLIGRWAEVTAQSDGQVYFGNNGWAGDTRIVGIYTDPEVALGHAAQGGPDDSQRRFQNDLFIGNIKSAVAAGDYDRDGFQEIYFSLNDGTAYLHALMWTDGNIKYANYQSVQQVRDYFDANHVSAVAWANWLHEEPLQVFAAPGAMASPLLSQGNGTALAGIAV